MVLMSNMLLWPSLAGAVEISAGWSLASSVALSGAGGAAISRGDYDASGWLELQHFPSTVLAALASNGSAPLANFSLPLYHGLSLNETNTSLFDVPWWYRAPLPTTAVSAVVSGASRAILTLRGINYRASVWVNGVLLASGNGDGGGGGSVLEGAFRYHDLDATAALKAAPAAAATTFVAIEVTRSYDYGLDCPHGTAFVPENQQVSCRGKSKEQATDLAITFVDWAPAPHDANLGLWRGVSLALPAAPAPITVRYPQVSTRLLPNGAARLEVLAEVQLWGSGEATTAALAGRLTAKIEGLFECESTELSLALGEVRRVLLTPDDCPALLLRNATTSGALWWPWQMGLPTQHNLSTAFVVSTSAAVAAVSPLATGTTVVGLREANVTLDANANAVLYINGRRLLVLGGGWAPDLLQRVTPVRNTQQLWLARDLGLNAIRLEGKFSDDDFFVQASALGLVVLPGICCCDAWQNWEQWSNRTFDVAMASVADQVKRLRAHASAVAFLYSSDQLPPPHVEAGYLNIFEQQRWAGGLFASAADTNSTLTGPSGVKMAGPYGWVPPNYWYTDTDTRQYGSAFGFATEISPGAAPLTLDSMKKTVDVLWDPSSPDGGPTEQWNYHCGAVFGAFGSLRHFTPALTARYGAGTSAADYLAKSQLAAYESHRAMFEGYSALRWRNATGLVQWMLNSAWPSNMWHLFDSYLQTGGSFFGAKKAIAQPLHLVYAYDESAPAPAPTLIPDCTQPGGGAKGTQGATVAKRGTVFIVNGAYEDDGVGLIAEATQFDLSGAELHAQELVLPAAVTADSAAPLFRLNGVAAASNATVLLRLQLVGRSDSENWYWLPPRQDEFEMGGCFTGCKIDRFADMHDLVAMPRSPHVTVQLGAAATASMPGLLRRTVTLSVDDRRGGGGNAGAGAGSGLAFFVRLRALDAYGLDVLPATWSDNFVTLLAGQQSKVVLEYEAGGTPVATVTAEPFNA